MSRFLVSDDCGVIDSHRADALRAAGFAVSLFDSLSTSRRDNFSEDSSVAVPGRPPAPPPRQIARFRPTRNKPWSWPSMRGAAAEPADRHT